jgi:hypothetical protein
MGDIVSSNLLMLFHVTLIVSSRGRGDLYAIQMLEFSSDVGRCPFPKLMQARPL